MQKGSSQKRVFSNDKKGLNKHTTIFTSFVRQPPTLLCLHPALNQMLSLLNVLFVLLALLQIQSGDCSTPHIEVSALHDLHNSTCGNSSWIWRNETEYGSKWDFEQAPDGSYLHNPCLGWQGIQCINSEGLPCNVTLQPAELCSVVNINLFEYNLTGSVPNSLGLALSHLQELTLWRNFITNSIPSSLGLLTELVLLDFDETG